MTFQYTHVYPYFKRIIEFFFTSSPENSTDTTLMITGFCHDVKSARSCKTNSIAVGYCLDVPGIYKSEAATSIKGEILDVTIEPTLQPRLST